MSVNDPGSVGEPSTERTRSSEKKILNVHVDKHLKDQEEPCVSFVSEDVGDGKTEKEEVEDDAGLDSEQDDPTGAI